MKIYKYTLMALALAGCMAACSDDDKYQPGTVESGYGAYFPSTDPTTINVDENGTAFAVKVERGNDAASATYDITTTANPDYFTVPATISFDAGQKEAMLNIGYVADSLGYDVKNNFTVTIVDAGNYGKAAIDLTVIVPAPWESLGKGTYVDGLMSDVYGVQSLSYEVEVQQNLKAPGQYRIADPYGKIWPYFEDADEAGYGKETRWMYIDCTNPDEVVMERFNSGLQVTAEGQLSYVEFASCNLYLGVDPSLWGKYVAEEGHISFPANSILLILNNTPWNYANSAGNTALYLPGYLPKDYTTEVEYLGLSTTPSGMVYANASVTLGADVAAAKAAIVETRSLTAAAQAVEDGSVESVDLNAGEDQKVQLEVEANGEYMFVVVAYDADGNVAGKSGQVFAANGVQASDTWVAEANGFGMIDAWLLPPLFGIDDPAEYEYLVELEQSKERPGVYRVVNPYGPDTPAGSYNDNPSVSYIVIDATDPDFVLMEPQYSGFTMEGGLDLYICDQASYDYYVNKKDKAAIVASGVANTMVDGVIKIAQPMYSPGGQGWFVSSDSDTLVSSYLIELLPDDGGDDDGDNSGDEGDESRASAHSMQSAHYELLAPVLKLSHRVDKSHGGLVANRIF